MSILNKFWKKKHKLAEEDKQKLERRGSFLAFVLLETPSWNKSQFIEDFKADWGISVSEEGDDASKEEYKDILMFSINTQRVVISYIDMPVPLQEAEQNASMNYMWKEAAEVTKKHQAHIMVALLGDHKDILDDGRLYVKVITSLCKQKNVLGINTNGIVYQPEFYTEMAGLMRTDEEIPLFNLVWFGLYQTEKGISSYTIGLNQFGLDEIEVLDVQDNPAEVRDFVVDMANYVVENDVILHDGETIGFSAEQKLPITRSEGVFTEGFTLKIGYGK